MLPTPRSFRDEQALQVLARIHEAGRRQLCPPRRSARRREASRRRSCAPDARTAHTEIYPVPCLCTNRMLSLRHRRRWPARYRARRAPRPAPNAPPATASRKWRSPAKRTAAAGCAAAHAADAHGRTVQRGQAHLGNRLAQLQRLAQRERAGRRDALVQHADLPRQRHAHDAEGEHRRPERNLRGDHEAHSNSVPTAHRLQAPSLDRARRRVRAARTPPAAATAPGARPPPRTDDSRPAAAHDREQHGVAHDLEPPSRIASPRRSCSRNRRHRGAAPRRARSAPGTDRGSPSRATRPPAR
jgi:hypothetical protein